jgi:Ribosomal protein L11 methyltransferase (PrmA)
MRIEYHRTLLADRVRNAAFYAALQRVIVAGETTVADIGAGTGFLGFLAAKLGARRVDLYESAEIAGVARKLLRHNRVAGARIAQVHSTEVVAPERVDVVVCETLGNYPFEENIIATLNDARARYLNEGGVIIPHRVEQFVVPVVGERHYRELIRWDEVGYGLDFAPAKAMTLNNIYVRWFDAGDLLEGGAAAQAWDKVVFDRRNKTTRAGEASWRMHGPATIYGLALWWRAELVSGVNVATGPLDPRTHWEQLYLPVLSPIAVATGQTLSANLRSTTSYERGTNVTWSLAVADAAGREVVRQALDLERGYLP